MKEKRSKKAARTYRVTDAVETYRAIRPEFDYRPKGPPHVLRMQGGAELHRKPQLALRNGVAGAECVLGREQADADAPVGRAEFVLEH